MHLTKSFDKIGAVGIFLTAFTSPCCFPLFGFILSALGFESFELFGSWTNYIFIGLILLSLLGLGLSYKRHKCLYPLLIAVPGIISFFYGYYFVGFENRLIFIYTGMLGILMAAVINFYKNKTHYKPFHWNILKKNRIELKSIISCPKCGFKKEETMPIDSCEFFYSCENCKEVLKPKKGDCCVHCSYGTSKCPPLQQGVKCC